MSALLLLAGGTVLRRPKAIMKTAFFLVVCFLTPLVSAEVEPRDPEVSAKRHEEAEVAGAAGGAEKVLSPPLGARGAGVFQDSDGDLVKIDSEVKDPANVSGGTSDNFFHAFIACLSVIIATELGDKTFFIAAIMAMRHSKMTVFMGAIFALAIMHVMSALFGHLITVIPRVYTYYVSSLLFAIFGIKMLREGYHMSPNEGQEELEEVQEDLRKREIDDSDLEGGGSGATNRRNPTNVFRFVSKIFLQAFTMTFLAEWGDRSQLATIVLAAREEIVGVILGGILGHALCTGLAVLGGRLIAQKISVRTVTLIGGIVFLLFALTAFFMDPNDS